MTASFFALFALANLLCALNPENGLAFLNWIFFGFSFGALLGDTIGRLIAKLA